MMLCTVILGGESRTWWVGELEQVHQGPERRDASKRGITGLPTVGGQPLIGATFNVMTGRIWRSIGLPHTQRASRIHAALDYRYIPVRAPCT